MTSWGERMASVVTACGPRPHPGLPYHRRLEKVKFGVPLEEVCQKDIPGPLLVMLLKLNKEGPYKKDVFRAPGHQGNTRKLIHFLQHSRLVNLHSFSVNTIASVLKKFLRKIPGGIFGPANELTLFTIGELETDEEKLSVVQSVFRSLPHYSQHLLVLLIGTFYEIHINSERGNTGMTAEALGISVAPSFFHTCVSEGKIAKPEEVQKFKLATRITTFFIEHFGRRDLFGRENYEYYARLTGRILKVEDEWMFFTYPPAIMSETSSGTKESLGVPGTSLKPSSSNEEVDRLAPSTPVSASVKEKSGSLEIIPENCSLDPSGRLSISLDDKNVSSPSSCGSPNQTFRHTQTLSMPGSAARAVSCLPQVHQRQTERMRHRSEWFLSDPSTGLVTVKCRPSSMVMPIPPASPLDSTGPPSLPSSRPPPLPSSQPPTRMGRLSPNVSCDKMMMSITPGDHPSSPLPKSGPNSTPKGQHAGQSDVRLRRRLSDKDKHRLVRRSSSKKNKENGSESTSGESGKCDNAETADRREGGGGGHTPVLKRTTSADSSSSNSHNHHAILARTRSEEGGQGASPGPGASPASGASDLIARSLPRI